MKQKMIFRQTRSDAKTKILVLTIMISIFFFINTQSAQSLGGWNGNLYYSTCACSSGSGCSSISPPFDDIMPNVPYCDGICTVMPSGMPQACCCSPWCISGTGASTAGCSGTEVGCCDANTYCTNNHCCPTGDVWNGSACVTPSEFPTALVGIIAVIIVVIIAVFIPKLSAKKKKK